jgi:non-specific serine/threonine protein kinase
MHVWLFYYRNAGYISEGRYRVGQALARAREPTVWRAQGLLLASFLAAPSGDHVAARALLAEGTDLARQLNDPATSAFAAYCTGNVCTSVGDVHRAIAHFEDGLAALPVAAVHGRQRAHLLVSLAIAAGLAGDEERVAACRQDLAVLTETGGESVRRWHLAYCLWAQGLAVWRRGDLGRAAGLQQESLRLRGGLNDLRRSTVCVEALAWIAASARQYERAAVLLGAAAGRWRSMAVTLDGVEHLAAYQRDCYRQTRQALGEQAFQVAYHRGLELPAEDAFAYALQRSSKPAVPAPAAPESGTVLLTPREMQVARLLAGGRSNKEIAAQLVISQRTAEGHVERILTKLSFTSRAEVAAWVASSRPNDDRR